MDNQLKLYKDSGNKKDKISAHQFPKSGLIGVDYESDLDNYWKMTSEMALRKYKEVFFTPSYVKNLLELTKKNTFVNVSEIILSSDPDIEEEINQLIDAFTSQEKTKRNIRLSKKLIDILYENDVTQVSFMFTQYSPFKKINIYQSGLVHISSVSDNTNDLQWLDDILSEVVT